MPGHRFRQRKLHIKTQTESSQTIEILALRNASSAEPEPSSKTAYAAKRHPADFSQLRARWQRYRPEWGSRGLWERAFPAI